MNTNLLLIQRASREQAVDEYLPLNTYLLTDWTAIHGALINEK